METTYMDSETVLPRYYPLPQFLLDLNISSTAKILYALLLNRANLSQKNAWEDEQGHVYCVYTIDELAADMKKGQTAIKNALNELSKQGVFCKHFLDIVAKYFWTLLHVQIGQNCNGVTGPSHQPLQTLFNCYSTRCGNGSSEFSSSCACSLK